MKKVKSCISGNEIDLSQSIRGDEIREGIYELIAKEHPEFKKDCYISMVELNHYRRMYLSSLILIESGELQTLDKDVMDAISKKSILSENIEYVLEKKLTFGQRIADHIAEFGGSWTFIISFFTFLLIWMAINIWMLANKPFDPYPFILLNLILSCLAAIQAPVIMMSQNRQEQKDRKRSENDYKINLKAELEIKLLHEKIDHLMEHQNRRLFEIQAVQTDYLEDLLKNVKNMTSK